MKFAVVVFPGSNCDVDCYHVAKEVLGQPTEYVWHASQDLAGADCVLLPGGFSYGDYLRSGAIASLSPVMQAVKAHAERGGLVVGICNGFQILLESGLLPGAMRRNDHLQFRCQHVYLKVEHNQSVFTRAARPGQLLQVPIAHMDGNYFVDDQTLQEMQQHGQILFRYATAEGKISPLVNPNGSIQNIAGICNRQGNVLGMMPHPERAAEAILGSADGKIIFDSILQSGGKLCG